jgi:hypothetical protein
MTQQGMAYNAGVAAPFATAARWLKVWVTIGTLVVLVVIGYLLAIVNALDNIHDNLAVTDPDVADIEGHVAPLPGHITTINDTLTAIDQTLLAIPGQATSIINTLTSIDGTLKDIDPTLKTINGGLTTALTGLRNIDATLVSLDTAGGDNRGLRPIIGEVTTINSQLRSIRVDTRRIDLDLNQNTGVAAHVRLVCNATLGLSMEQRCGS